MSDSQAKERKLICPAASLWDHNFYDTLGRARDTFACCEDENSVIGGKINGFIFHLR